MRTKFDIYVFIITETGRAHYIWYLRFYAKIWRISI